jgi:hypothetical protein
MPRKVSDSEHEFCRHDAHHRSRAHDPLTLAVARIPEWPAQNEHSSNCFDVPAYARRLPFPLLGLDSAIVAASS